MLTIVWTVEILMQEISRNEQMQGWVGVVDFYSRLKYLFKGSS